MNYLRAILLTLALFTGSNSFSQDLLNRLNNLPPTLIHKAPVFDVEKKYIFSVDSVHKLMYIQDYGRKPNSRVAHFNQIIYEIPLADLSAGSFLISRDIDNSDLLKFNIGTSNNRTSIVQYFIANDDVVAVLVQDFITLGKWDYTAQLESELNKIIQLFIERIPDKTKSTKFTGIKSMHKYSSGRVTAIGLKDTTQELNGGYCFLKSLKNPSFYSGKTSFESSGLKLAKDLKTELNKISDTKKGSGPAFVYINHAGLIESVFFLNLSDGENRKLDLNVLDKFNPGNNGSGNVKSKMLLIVK